MTERQEIDPVTFEVIWNQILDITEDMGIKYMRTSGSPVLVGAYDAATSVNLPSGELVAMGPYITTQAHVMRLLIESTQRMRSKNPGINDGDMWIVNDPYLGATHQPDVATLAPVHHDGKLRAWVGSSGHWLDIGGSEPGGFNMRARTVFDEGLRMSPLRVMRGGDVQNDVVDLVMSNVREPLVELDLRGQMVSNETGRERLIALFDKYGVETVESVMRGGIDHAESRMRARLLELPDGVWREVQYLDHDGHRSHKRAIVCTLTKQGSQLTLDFDGSSAEVAGFANSAYGGLRAAALSGICVTLGYDITWNDGIARCVEIKVPRKTIVSAEYPTPVSMSTISAVIVTLNLVMTAASRLLLCSEKYRDQAMAGWCGTSIGYSIAGVNRDSVFGVCAEASHFGAGCGARTFADGVDTGGIIINTTAKIPSIEETEEQYPVLYITRHQLTDSGGPGKYRGGMSGGVALTPYDAQGELETSFAGVGAEVPNGYGIAGGLPGSTLRLSRYANVGSLRDILLAYAAGAGGDQFSGDKEIIASNVSLLPLRNGTVEYHNWQGAGGYGDPLLREADSVARDVRSGAVSVAAARDIYGVVVEHGLADEAVTQRLREDIRALRLTRATPPGSGLRGSSGDDGAVELPASFSGVSGTSVIGSIDYAETLVFDFDTNEVRCRSCDHILGSATDDFRSRALHESRPASAAGQARGEDYLDPDDSVFLDVYYCVCGIQLEVDVRVEGFPRPGFRLAASTGA